MSFLISTESRNNKKTKLIFLPSFLRNYSIGLMSRHTNVFDTFYLTQLDVLMEEVVSKWPDADYYLAKLRRVRDNLMELGAKAFEPDPSHFNTLIHGDMFVDFSYAFFYCSWVTTNFPLQVGQ